MNKETLDLLQQLAARLGTTAEHLWTVLIRQAYVSLFSDLIVGAVFTSLIVILYRGAKSLTRKAREVEAHHGDSFGEWVGVIGLYLLAVIFTGIVASGLPDTITKIANPEYWALQQVLETIGGKR